MLLLYVDPSVRRNAAGYAIFCTMSMIFFGGYMREANGGRVVDGGQTAN